MIIIEEKKKFSAEDEHVSYKKIDIHTQKIKYLERCSTKQRTLCTIEEITKELKSQGVVDAKRENLIIQKLA